MSDIIFILFSAPVYAFHHVLLDQLIRNPPSVTSIRVPHYHRVSVIRDASLFSDGHTGSHKIETFLHDNQSQLARTRRTHVFMYASSFFAFVSPARLQLSYGCKIAVSFFGPSSGNIILTLTHWAEGVPVTLILKESQGSRTFEYTVPSSLTVTTIAFSPSPSDHPSFERDTRNNLIIELEVTNWGTYVIQDIQLLDEAGNDYNAASSQA
jgi:hypothetical protein